MIVTVVPVVFDVILDILLVVLACPDNASLPFTLFTVTLVVYQLLLPNVPVNVAVPAVGAVLSKLYVLLHTLVVLLLLSVT